MVARDGIEPPTPAFSGAAFQLCLVLQIKSGLHDREGKALTNTCRQVGFLPGGSEPHNANPDRRTEHRSSPV